MIDFYIYTLIFIASVIVLLFSGRLLVKGLTRISRFLKWKEFVVAFFVMAFAGSAPNFFVGIDSALHKVPELSFGDVVGGNVICLTLAVALAVLISKKSINAKSDLIQTSSLFTFLIALLPLVLILDGKLSRGDGILSISIFFVYIFWLFSKEDRFKKIYHEKKKKNHKTIDLRLFLKDLARVILSLILLIGAAEGVVKSASFFAENFSISLPLIGILTLGIANALPEIYFAVISAKHGENWMILGSLMGSVIILTTLVLGIVALICPITITNISTYAIARFFLIISALFFYFCVRTDCRVTKKEAVFLLAIYACFILFEIFLI